MPALGQVDSGAVSNTFRRPSRRLIYSTTGICRLEMAPEMFLAAPTAHSIWLVPPMANARRGRLAMGKAFSDQKSGRR